MLRIYPVILDWLSALTPIIASIRTVDSNLADQLRRSSASVALNVAEGTGATGGRKRNSYRIALAEMRESMAAIEIATRLAYTEALDDDAEDRQQKIVATLIKLAVPWKK